MLEKFKEFHQEVPLVTVSSPKFQSYAKKSLQKLVHFTQCSWVAL